MSRPVVSLKRRFANADLEETCRPPPSFTSNSLLTYQRHELNTTSAIHQSGSNLPDAHCDSSSSKILLELRDDHLSSYTNTSISTASQSSLGTPASCDPDASSAFSEICYGMIGDVFVAPLTVNRASKSLVSQDGRNGSWRLGFCSETAVLLNEKSVVVGQVDAANSSVLYLLQQNIPSVRCEVFLVSAESSKFHSPAARKAFQACINVYGDKGDRDRAGEELDDKKVFLQEPLIQNSSIPYSNPHVYSMTDEGVTPRFAAQYGQIHQQFNDAINSALSDNITYHDKVDFVQDARIRSSLQNHQVMALKFALSRETNLPSGHLTFWQPIMTSLGMQYRHCLTGDMNSMPYNECRGGLIADEMGMGKSLSILSLIVHTLAEADVFTASLPMSEADHGRRPIRATLIVTPLSTIESWTNEIRRHLYEQDIEFVIYHGPNRLNLASRLERVAIVVTTYEMVARESASAGSLLGLYRWFRIVLDEAHHIRNTSTQMFSAVTSLDAERRWCLTGTPIQNDLNDMFALTAFLRFFPFATRKDTRKYITDLLNLHNKQGLVNLRHMMKVCSIRRSKRDLDIPAIKFEERSVLLSEAERALYDSVKADLLKELSQAARKGGRQTSVMMLRGIQRLRQICCHGLDHVETGPQPGQPSRSSDLSECSSCAADIGILTESTVAKFECGHQFCNECLKPPEMVGTLREQTHDPCYLCEEAGKNNPVKKAIERSSLPTTESNSHDQYSLNTTLKASKIDAVIRSLFDLHRTDAHADAIVTKSLVFTYWIRTLNAIEAALQPLGIHYVRIDGRTTLEQRQEAIATFQSDPQYRVALLTLGTGSVGLTLTAASYVHLVEPHWNPMVEEQAAARAHRIGQTRTVHVYRYIVQDSIEELIRNKQKQKLHLAHLAGVRDEQSHATMTNGHVNEPVNDLDQILEKCRLI